jgi:hypothetical protein
VLKPEQAFDLSCEKTKQFQEIGRVKAEKESKK